MPPSAQVMSDGMVKQFDGKEEARLHIRNYFDEHPDR